MPGSFHLQKGGKHRKIKPWKQREKDVNVHGSSLSDRVSRGRGAGDDTLSELSAALSYWHGDSVPLCRTRINLKA